MPVAHEVDREAEGSRIVEIRGLCWLVAGCHATERERVDELDREVDAVVRNGLLLLLRLLLNNGARERDVRCSDRRNRRGRGPPDRQVAGCRGGREGDEDRERERGRAPEEGAAAEPVHAPP